MISEKQQEILEKRLLGDLTDDELKQFEAFREDVVFQREMDLWQELQTVFTVRGRQRRKERLQAKEEQLAKTLDNRMRKSIKIWIGIAATAIILLGILVLLPSKNGSQAIFVEYFTPANNTSFLITRGAEDISLKARAFSAYEGAQYDIACNLFGQLDQNDTIAFYSAIGHLVLGDYNRSKNLLLDSELEDGSFLHQNVAWYLALSHLALGEVVEATTVLETITSIPNHFKKNDATMILRRLRN